MYNIEVNSLHMKLCNFNNNCGGFLLRTWEYGILMGWAKIMRYKPISYNPEREIEDIHVCNGENINRGGVGYFGVHAFYFSV